MTAHQVITGALNKGESVFAVGSVEGINFTVCAVGCDVVILASNFERVQIIPGSAFGEEAIVTCVDCCLDSGKIAAAYGHTIRIFEPTHYIGEKAKHKLDYRWFETSAIDTGGVAMGVFWNLEGLRLLVNSGSRLQLYQHRMLSAYYNTKNKTNAHHHLSDNPVSFTITDEDPEDSHQMQNPQQSWLPIWETHLSAPAQFIKYSPDGALFATCGENDRLVKIWYQDSGDCDGRTDVSFGFTYLQHPAAVVGFEWRKTGRYMPRHCMANVLMTWCKDNTSRIWKETPTYDGADMSCETLDNSSIDFNNRKKLHHKHFRMRHARHKITHRLKQLKIMKNKSGKKGGSTADDHQGQQHQSPSRLVSSPSFYDSAAAPFTAPNMLHFHLAASINAETDCFLVPSLESTTAVNKPFAVHWLNNKELVFSLGAEKLLAEALLNEQRDSRGHSPAIISNEDMTKCSIAHSFSGQSSVDSGDQPAMTGD
uniref:Uncharacterized protein n=1 Tax=Plectus sambesii TaxID=2011161 RepID=A0A914VV83_9BILA